MLTIRKWPRIDDRSLQLAAVSSSPPWRRPEFSIYHYAFPSLSGRLNRGAESKKFQDRESANRPLFYPVFRELWHVSIVAKTKGEGSESWRPREGEGGGERKLPEERSRARRTTPTKWNVLLGTCLALDTGRAPLMGMGEGV